VASATGIVRVAMDDAESFEQATPLRDRILAKEAVDTKVVMDMAKDGDAYALYVVNKISEYLGFASGNIGNILNPSTIVIGGGVSKAGEFLVDYIRKYFDVYAFPTVRTSTKIRLAELGNDAGVIGASSLVLNESLQERFSK